MQKNARGKIIQYWWRWAKSLALKSLNRGTGEWLLIRINCPHFRLIILLPVSQGKKSRSNQETSPKIPQLDYLHKFSYSLLPYFRRTVTEVSSQLLHLCISFHFLPLTQQCSPNSLLSLLRFQFSLLDHSYQHKIMLSFLQSLRSKQTMKKESFLTQLFSLSTATPSILSKKNANQNCNEIFFLFSVW